MTTILVPLRSALFNVWFVMVTIVVAGAGTPCRWVGRRHALRFAQVWAGLLLDGARVICGIRVVVTGREHLPPGGPMLIASQHQSAFDTLIWLRLLPRVAYVFKAELSRVPLFGPLLIPAGQIPVARGGINAVRTLLRGGDRAKADNRQIVVFPEGTRVRPGEDVPLRPGIALLANRTGLPVIPVATDSGLLWGRRAFNKRPGIIHIVIGPPIPPDLPQAEMVAALRARWQDAERSMAVDNSVHGPVPAM
jgi:1-acyl-sn-glycerol-3-phosphate acyltransferase